MCWFQGEDHKSIGSFRKMCIKKWRDLNSDREVNVLTNDNIADHVPEFFEIVKDSPERTYQAKSDLLRLLLLSKYGGTWVDATVYPTQPLSEFYDKIVNRTGFFSYRFMPRSISKKGKGDREIVSWFLCSDKSNYYIIEKWKTKFISKFKNSKHWKYFTIHQVLADLYDEEEQVKHTIDNMVQISEKIPHSACLDLKKTWADREISYIYKRPNLPKSF